MSAAKPMTQGRLIVAFQPHRFTRTQMLIDDFGPAFSGADVVVLTDIYGADEEPIPGIDVDGLADAVRRSFTGEVRVVRSLAGVAAELGGMAEPGDLLVLLGAGSIGSIAPDVLRAIRRVG
jgi:UDP-N-acetylmuramate--alanine ligase